jgi:hypothetical protein
LKANRYLRAYGRPPLPPLTEQPGSPSALPHQHQESQQAGPPAPTSSTSHPTGLQVPSDDSERKRPPPPPGPQQTGSQGPAHHLPPPGAKSNLKFKVDVDEECDVPAPALERLGSRSKAGSQAGPPAPPAQQYLPELVNPELIQALRKISRIRSIAELLPTLTDPNCRAVNVKEFFRSYTPHTPTACHQTSICTSCGTWVTRAQTENRGRY